MSHQLKIDTLIDQLDEALTLAQRLGFTHVEYLLRMTLLELSDLITGRRTKTN